MLSELVYPLNIYE